MNNRSIQREQQLFSQVSIHQTNEKKHVMSLEVVTKSPPKENSPSISIRPDVHVKRSPHKTVSSVPNKSNMTLPHNKRYPSRGTVDKMRYSSSDYTIKLYPRNEQSLSIHPSSNWSMKESLCGKSNDDSKNQYLRQYRNHKRMNSFHSPTNDTILIIVNYHFNHYGSISFFDSTFFPAFAQLYPTDFDVVYIGANCHRPAKVLRNAYTHRGRYSYHSFRLVYDLFSEDKYPYKGYLFMNDDSYVDPQFLSSYNLSTSWKEYSIPYSGRTRWPWNDALNVNKVSYSEAFYNAMDEIVSDRSINNRCHFTSPGSLRKGWGDFFYVYRGDVSFFLKLEEVMFRHRVFLELAVPTIIHCINPKPFIDCNHGKMENRLRCVHIHPVKLSHSNLRSYMMKRLNHDNMYEVPIVKYYSVWFDSPSSHN